MESTGEKFLADVEGYLAEHDMDPTTFGRLAMSDPSFVFDLRRGRAVRATTLDRVYGWMREDREDAA